MKAIELAAPLPPEVVPPLKMREKGGGFEGEVQHPTDVVRMFEPLDVINGAIELVDQNGLVLTIETDDPTIAERNEYPRSWQRLWYSIHA